MGNSHYFLTRYAQAIDCYQKALVIDAENPDFHFNLGNAYQEQKDFS